MSPQFLCALDTAGRAWCAGNGADGQLGNGELWPFFHLAPVAHPGPFVQITAGTAHACALTDDGAVWCWGRNDRGQLGPSVPARQASPVAVEAFSPARAVRAGGDATCVLGRDGVIRCWGFMVTPEYRQWRLGAPANVSLQAPVVHFRMSENGLCALDETGRAWCVDDPADCSSGGGSEVYDTPQIEMQPMDVLSGGAPVLDACMAVDYSCVLTEARDLMCAGQLPDGYFCGKEPERIASGVRTLSCSGVWLCFVGESGVTRCLDYHSLGRPGDHHLATLPGRHAFERITAGPNSGCGVDEGGALWCWGNHAGVCDHFAERDASDTCNPTSPVHRTKGPGGAPVPENPLWACGDGVRQSFEVCDPTVPNENPFLTTDWGTFHANCSDTCALDWSPALPAFSVPLTSAGASLSPVTAPVDGWDLALAGSLGGDPAEGELLGDGTAAVMRLSGGTRRPIWTRRFSDDRPMHVAAVAARGGQIHAVLQIGNPDGTVIRHLAILDGEGQLVSRNPFVLSDFDVISWLDMAVDPAGDALLLMERRRPDLRDPDPVLLVRKVSPSGEVLLDRELPREALGVTFTDEGRLLVSMAVGGPTAGRLLVTEADGSQVDRVDLPEMTAGAHAAVAVGHELWIAGGRWVEDAALGRIVIRPVLCRVDGQGAVSCTRTDPGRFPCDFISRRVMMGPGGMILVTGRHGDLETGDFCRENQFLLRLYPQNGDTRFAVWTPVEESLQIHAVTILGSHAVLPFTQVYTPDEIRLLEIPSGF